MNYALKFDKTSPPTQLLICPPSAVGLLRVWIYEAGMSFVEKNRQWHQFGPTFWLGSAVLHPTKSGA